MKRNDNAPQPPAEPVAIRDCLPEEEREKGRTSPRKGKMAVFDGHACLAGKCGENIEIFLRFQDERVSDASFVTDGCGSITACGSRATSMAIGRTTDELLEITGEAILGEMEGFPQTEAHCADLAAETLQEALHDFMVREKAKDRK